MTVAPGNIYSNVQESAVRYRSLHPAGWRLHKAVLVPAKRLNLKACSGEGVRFSRTKAKGLDIGSSTLSWSRQTGTTRNDRPVLVAASNSIRYPYQAGTSTQG